MNLAQRMSHAAHESLLFANPLSIEQLNSLVEAIAEAMPATCFDIGCGTGYLSIALAQKAAVEITAVDLNPGFIARAQLAASKQKLQGTIAFQVLDAKEVRGHSFDCIICVGASQACPR